MNIDFKSPLAILKAVGVLAALIAVLKVLWMLAAAGVNMISAGTGDKARATVGI